MGERDQQGNMRAVSVSVLPPCLTALRLLFCCPTSTRFDVFRATRAITNNIAYCLPRNIKPDQVRDMASLSVLPAASGPTTAVDDQTPAAQLDDPACTPLPCELEENCINGKVKMMTAYFGDLVCYNGDAAEEQQDE